MHKMQVLNAHGRVYPTPPPSRRPIRVKQACLAAERAALEADEPQTGAEGTAKQESDNAGRLKLCMPFSQLLQAQWLIWKALKHTEAILQGLCMKLGFV